MNLSLGSSSKPSIIGLKLCSHGYWTIYSLFIVICIFATALAVWMAKRDQSLKEKYGRLNMVPSDIQFTGRKIAVVIALGFCGGFIAGALGLGGGIIYNPVLLTLGLPPMVSAASGLYLVTFSKIATSLVYLING